MIVLSGLSLPGPSARAAPEPDLFGERWQLEFTFLDPQRITVRTPADGVITYWYLIYEVTNSTGRDVEFYPSFTLVTSYLESVTGGDQVHPLAYEAIAARHAREFPFLVPPSRATGPLLQGAENRRASVAVFRVPDLRAGQFSIFVGGLSGEVIRVPHPLPGKAGVPDPADPPLLLRRTLAVHYDLPGDRRTRATAAPVRRHREWVMR